jgi:hypothetical protein
VLAIGLPESTSNIAEVLAQLGGGFIASVQQAPEGIPATVNVKQGRIILSVNIVTAGTNVLLVFGSLIPAQQRGVCKAVYEDFLPTALTSGQFKPSPEPKLIRMDLSISRQELIC